MEQDMESNNHGNSRWKNKLEDVSGFDSTDLPDTNAAWDKLYNRMHQPHRKKAAWYWAAAACFLIGIGSVLVFFHQQIQRPGTAQATVKKQAPKPHNSVKEKEQPAIVLTPGKKEMEKAEIKQAGKNDKPSPDGKAAKNNMPFTVSDKVTLKQERLIPLPGNEMAREIQTPMITPTAAIAQPKPKLKVVHINELGSTAEDNNTRPASDFSLIQFGITNQQVYNKIPAPSGKIGLNISTSKTSPSN